MLLLVLPLFHVYANGLVLPVVVIMIEPSASPLHFMSVMAGETVNTGDTATVADALAVHVSALTPITV
jgi:hypothetical protein